MFENLNPTQKDALLDLFLCCKSVSYAFDQQEASELDMQTKAEEGECEAVEEEPCYKEALSEFVDCYSLCEEHGIPEDILDSVTFDHLPVGLCRRLYART